MGRSKQHIIAIFKDRHGDVIIGQRPNAVLVVWITLVVVRLFASAPPALDEVLGWATFFAGLTWSALELFWGVNMFRHLLGGVVLVILLSRFFM
jgi:hypothetical protein